MSDASKLLRRASCRGPARLEARECSSAACRLPPAPGGDGDEARVVVDMWGTHAETEQQVNNTCSDRQKATQQS